jgi:hypothetical protein
VRDIAPRFLDFYEAAKDVPDADARFAIWKAKYGFAAVPPTPEGQAMARQLVDAAWPKYAAALPTIRAGAKAMRPEPLSVLQAVAAVLKPDEAVTVRVNTYVGGFEPNAFTYSMKGVPVVSVPLELSPEQRTLIFPHEMTHAVHMAIGKLSGGWERTIGTTALQEGLAMQVTREVVPGRPVTEYVSADPGWWDKVLANRKAILQGLKPDLDKKDAQTVFKYTIGDGATGLHREAYATGWFVVERLRKDGMSLAQIARIPEADMPAVVGRAIDEILAEK